MKVADVMIRQVEFVAPDATAQDAAALMGELDVSALPVGTPDEIKGIVTHRDLLYRVVAEGRDPRWTRVGEIATRLVFTCRSDDALGSAMDLMAAHNIRRLPVTEDGRVVGWLTLSDVARKVALYTEVRKTLAAMTETLQAEAKVAEAQAKAADEPEPAVQAAER